MVKKAFYWFLYSVILMGCHVNNAHEKRAPEVVHGQKALEDKPDFNQIDSVECVYAKRAENNKETATFFITDSLFINTLKTVLAAPQVQAEECTHEVKLYLYKNGEVYKTLYASLNPHCNYLAYAINGQAYFVPLSSALHQLLKGHLKRAAVPQG